MSARHANTAPGPARSDADRPIGVFDSGVGGLSVVAELMRRLPSESILYLGDTARLPYGSKSPQTVSRYTRRNIDFLFARDVKAVVVACNTASALALSELDFSLPIWGVIEPGAAAAVAATAGRVGVIATESTILSDAYGRAIRRLAPEVHVDSQACPLFVPLVEEGWSDDPISQQIAERYLAPLVAAGIDTLVLGCTHYPMLKPVLRRVIGDGVRLVDSAEAVARQVATELTQRRLVARGEARHHICVTDGSEHFRRVAADLLAHSLLPAAANRSPADTPSIDEPLRIGGSVSLELVEV